MALRFCGFTGLSGDKGAWSPPQAQSFLCSFPIPVLMWPAESSES